MTFTVELAVTPAERALGLMSRDSLERDSGMLFIYQADATPGFWMRGMLFPLDIVWIDSDGIVAGVLADLPPAQGESSPLLHYPPRPIRYVLEINAGMAKELGIRAGSRTTLLGIPLVVEG